MRIGRTIGDGYGDGDNVLRQIPSAQFLARFSRDSLFEGFAKYLAVRIADEQQVTADVVTVDSVPSLSILDGWWIEGCIEGRTGWAIDPGPVDNDRRTSPDAEALYDKLDKVIIPLYTKNRPGFIDVMSHAIALNGSFFNTQRMVLEYNLEGLLSLRGAIE